MTQLPEQLIQDSFHSYLKSSLTQAKAERLLDADLLSSAQADLMITGPALCLYFAALRSTTNPPSVPLPRLSKNTSPIDLSYENCPPVFARFLRVWAEMVPQIQRLAPEHQHDLARIICGLEPISQQVHLPINGIAANLRAVAIEISQRRSFQDRYASDLQAVLDAGDGRSGTRKKASFVPPPVYEESPTSTPPTSPRSSVDSKRRSSRSHSRSPSRPELNRDLPPLPPPPAPDLLSPGYSSSSPSFPKRSNSPSFLAPSTPAIEFIRETLYASLGDALERHPSLRRLLKRDPPRAYFASVAFAILDVATTAVSADGTSIVGVLGTPLAVSDCPPELRPFMMELIGIGTQARELEEADNAQAMECARKGEDIPEPILDRARMVLQEGIVPENERRASVEGRAVAFANRINALSLAMTKLRPFKERQEEVFKVLAGIGS